jgi:mannose-1-phosphate guanylyltransferase
LRHPDRMIRQNRIFEHAYAVILAGGSGTRFWPLSRRRQPKQLLRLFGEKTLLAQTLERIERLIPPERTYIFTNQTIQSAVRREVPRVPRQQIVAEPASRNTAPALGLAAFEILSRDPEGLMVALPSDHLIAKPAQFRRVLLVGCKTAFQEGRSVVIGLKPTRPETGYGYIHRGERVGRENGLEIFAVRQFTEKPPLAKAKRYVRSGNYFWNGGMFIWKAATLVKNLQRYQPEMARRLERLAAAGGIRSEKTLKRLYPQLENISIDYALMEKIPEVYAVAADIGWSDVGSWATAYELRPKDRDENIAPAAGFLFDSRSNMIVSPKRFIAAVGVEDLVIVDTEDALLVCSRHHAQDVGKVVRELERRNLKSLL